jgi:hypothetical protein
MSFKEFCRKTAMDFFIIVTGITIAIAILGINTDPNATFGYEAYFSPVIFGAVAVLPSFVFYSGRELSMKRMLRRRVFHFVILEAALLAFGFLSGLLRDRQTIVGFAFTVFAVYLFTNVVKWLIDSKTAGEINEGLKRIHQASGSDR